MFNVGIDAIQSGQKSNAANAEPRLIANSTQGKFQITGPVSKKLGIAVGENVEFFNNISGLERLADNPNEEVLTFCEENQIDLNTDEGKREFIELCTTWYIAKGHQQFTANGKPLMSTVRCSKEDKLEAIELNGADMIKDENFRAMLIERVGDENASDEDLIAAISVDDIKSPETEAYTGSKTATTGLSTGVGCQLTFTDTFIWNAMKNDLGDEKDKKNRNFEVLLNSPEKVSVNDGFKTITVDAYPVKFINDTDPIVRERKND